MTETRSKREVHSFGVLMEQRSSVPHLDCLHVCPPIISLAAPSFAQPLPAVLSFNGRLLLFVSAFSPGQMGLPHSGSALFSVTCVIRVHHTASQSFQIVLLSNTSQKQFKRCFSEIRICASCFMMPTGSGWGSNSLVWYLSTFTFCPLPSLRAFSSALHSASEVVYSQLPDSCQVTD